MKKWRDVLYSVMFAYTQDNMLIINPCICTNTLQAVKVVLYWPKKDIPNITKEMHDWFSMLTSFNIDRVITVFQQKKQIIPDVVVPIHNNNHFVMIDVFLPFDKIPNSQFNIYDYLDSWDKNKNWVQKCGELIFGIYYQANSWFRENKYMGILDMNPAGFKSTNEKQTYIQP